MKQNMGGADRVVRSIIGIALIVWGVMAHNWWGAIGVIPLVTALSGWCPLYLPFGISSKKES
jgi:hypothetical protein